MVDFDDIEWGSVANWVSGLGSIFASCVALYLAHFNRKVRLQGYFGHRVVIGGGAPQMDLISISATNIGQRSTVINNVGLRSGLFRKRYALINVVRDQYSDGIPKELPDGSRAHWGVPLDQNKTWLFDLLKDDFVKSPLDIATLCAQVHTTNGGTTNIRAEKGLRTMLLDELRRRRDG